MFFAFYSWFIRPHLTLQSPAFRKFCQITEPSYNKFTCDPWRLSSIAFGSLTQNFSHFLFAFLTFSLVHNKEKSQKVMGQVVEVSSWNFSLTQNSLISHHYARNDGRNLNFPSALLLAPSSPSAHKKTRTNLFASRLNLFIALYTNFSAAESLIFHLSSGRASRFFFVALDDIKTKKKGWEIKVLPTRITFHERLKCTHRPEKEEKLFNL